MTATEQGSVLVEEIRCPNCPDYFLYCGSCDGGLGKIPVPAAATPLSDAERAVIDGVLRIREHETHALAREDYLTNDGQNWLELHQRRVTELSLRERFGLPPHPFGACCKSPVTEDTATDDA